MDATIYIFIFAFLFAGLAAADKVIEVYSRPMRRRRR